MSIWDSIIEKLTTPEETEEEKKKRIALEAAKNPLLKAARRPHDINQAVEDAIAGK